MDFKQLHKDVAEAVEADKKYQRENAAKFRAVEQKVENYNQFAAIVKGCHLRPLDKKEKITTLAQSIPSWNASSSSSKYSLESEVMKYFPSAESNEKITKSHLDAKN